MIDQKMAYIEQLKSQLLSLGYYPFQLETLTRDLMTGRETEASDGELVDGIIFKLEGQIEFARKCLNSNDSVSRHS